MPLALLALPVLALVARKLALGGWAVFFACLAFLSVGGSRVPRVSALELGLAVVVIAIGLSFRRATERASDGEPWRSAAVGLALVVFGVGAWLARRHGQGIGAALVPGLRGEPGLFAFPALVAVGLSLASSTGPLRQRAPLQAGLVASSLVCAATGGHPLLAVATGFLAALVAADGLAACERPARVALGLGVGALAIAGLASSRERPLLPEEDEHIEFEQALPGARVEGALLTPISGVDGARLVLERREDGALRAAPTRLAPTLPDRDRRDFAAEVPTDLGAGTWTGTLELLGNGEVLGRRAAGSLRVDPFARWALGALASSLALLAALLVLRRAAHVRAALLVAAIVHAAVLVTRLVGP